MIAAVNGCTSSGFSDGAANYAGYTVVQPVITSAPVNNQADSQWSGQVSPNNLDPLPQAKDLQVDQDDDLVGPKLGDTTINPTNPPQAWDYQNDNAIQPELSPASIPIQSMPNRNETFMVRLVKILPWALLPVIVIVGFILFRFIRSRNE